MSNLHKETAVNYQEPEEVQNSQAIKKEKWRPQVAMDLAEKFGLVVEDKKKYFQDYNRFYERKIRPSYICGFYEALFVNYFKSLGYEFRDNRFYQLNDSTSVNKSVNKTDVD